VIALRGLESADLDHGKRFTVERRSAVAGGFVELPFGLRTAVPLRVGIWRNLHAETTGQPQARWD
jgi:hypothetical protein